MNKKLFFKLIYYILGTVITISIFGVVGVNFVNDSRLLAKPSVEAEAPSETVSPVKATVKGSNGDTVVSGTFTYNKDQNKPKETAKATPKPTSTPVEEPTATPTPKETATPSPSPTTKPTTSPTTVPSPGASGTPTTSPTTTPKATQSPSQSPATQATPSSSPIVSASPAANSTVVPSLGPTTENGNVAEKVNK